ncbi:glucosamine 6-phosphate N-acetyltransferase [Reticulomyxa filosa]|uniref:Glucosamine 6-phosphate N-acetyltransferase n=1 Tax=Reticulomyxa filosa TaxID=46433 RepID=X6LW89_RETFI|nr:glucosamine 6-phosphate N-acetyltransferase [Reticulomyxa filosa]|eukprot:ETO04980.1 glucosamine 6-phosphate N-acetyltransferase [Reticulomyxa filosa]
MATEMKTKESSVEDSTLKLRPLEKEDFKKGYLELLSQLTQVGEITEKQFNETFDVINSNKSSQVIYVIESTTEKKIVATGTLLAEQKFIHGCGKCGHIEDVVVDNSYRGKHFGQRIISKLVEIAKADGKIYKVILDCNDKNIEFYKKCGFDWKGNEMALYFN